MQSFLQSCWDGVSWLVKLPSAYAPEWILVLNTGWPSCLSSETPGLSVLFHQELHLHFRQCSPTSSSSQLFSGPLRNLILGKQSQRSLQTSLSNFAALFWSALKLSGEDNGTTVTVILHWSGKGGLLAFLSSFSLIPYSLPYPKSIISIFIPTFNKYWVSRMGGEAYSSNL